MAVTGPTIHRYDDCKRLGRSSIVVDDNREFALEFKKCRPCMKRWLAAGAPGSPLPEPTAGERYANDALLKSSGGTPRRSCSPSRYRYPSPPTPDVLIDLADALEDMLGQYDVALSAVEIQS